MKWRTLKPGDTIECPRDGAPERVLRVERRGSTMFVRTARHDHHQPHDERVRIFDLAELQPAPAATRGLDPLSGRVTCCPKAEVLACVCVWASTCPDHGQDHHGSHD